MPPPSRTIDPERLLRQSEWVRRLARRLVGDAELAEDVAQDAWVAALERPGAGSGRGGLAAWLAAVARNLALRRRRREGLRGAVERAAARREARGGGAEEVERMQLQRSLADAVLGLREPLRTAVILRHLDGCSAAEIARRQGCTVEAARQRVSRGLAQLRATLEDELGGGVALGLAPLLGRGGDATWWTGGLLVTNKTALGIVGAVVAATVWWIAAPREATRPGVGDPVAERTGAGLPVAPPPPEGGGAEEPVRPSGSELGALAGSGRVEVAAAPQRAEGASPELAGIVVDTRGEALAGARVRLLAGGVDDPEATSDGSGRFSFPLEPAATRERARLDAGREGYVSRTLDVEPSDALRIELLRLPELVGRVTDARGLSAAPPGFVKAQVLDGAGKSRWIDGELADDGSYRIAGLPLGRLLAVEARARGSSETRILVERLLEPERTVEQDVTLGVGAEVAGIVVDARSREPIASARVWLESFQPPGEDSVHPSTRTDALGRFRLTGADEQPEVLGDAPRRYVIFWVGASAEGYGTDVAHRAEPAEESHRYEVELELARVEGALELEVALADGRPAKHGLVWAIDARRNVILEVLDGAGRHRFEGLPEGRIALWMTYEEDGGTWGSSQAFDGAPERFAPLATGKRRHALRAELELVAGQVRRERFVLEPPGEASLAGRVLDLDGRPVADHPVHAQRNFGVEGLSIGGATDELRTDADGAYRFEGLFPGRYQVWATTDAACASPDGVKLEVAADEAAEVPAFVVGGCRTLEGRIDAGVWTPAELELAALDVRTGKKLAGTRPGEDGRFRFEPVLAVECEVLLLRDDEVLDRRLVAPGAAGEGLFLSAR